MGMMRRSVEVKKIMGTALAVSSFWPGSFQVLASAILILSMEVPSDEKTIAGDRQIPGRAAAAL